MPSGKANKIKADKAKKAFDAKKVANDARNAKIKDSKEKAKAGGS